jgi:anti-sigma factor RsiW
VRRDLVAGSPGAALRRHLASCPRCTRFSRRFTQASRLLDGHHTTVVPDPGFVGRVLARLPERPPLVGWAALRMLPIAAALAVVLAAWVWLGTARPSELVAFGPTDDVVSWVLTNGAGGQ